jgi:hypothetical protein
MEKLFQDEEDMPKELWLIHKSIKNNLLVLEGEILPPCFFL